MHTGVVLVGSYGRIIGGNVPGALDFSTFTLNHLPVVMGGVLLLSFLLLMAVFRSVVVPLKAVIMNLISIGAAYGVVVAVFEWGWFGNLGVSAQWRYFDSVKLDAFDSNPLLNNPNFQAATDAKLGARSYLDLLATLPRRERALYEDEVDIHLHPKVGQDWMVSGQQKEVVTPGQNQKRYLAGAQDTRTGELIWVEAEKKNSWLFLDLLKRLVTVYPRARVIHVILDNYSIHSSEVVGIALAHFASQIRLVFLPPYSPDHNRIERVWEDLHADVTRNHQCPTMTSLMQNVYYYLEKRNQTTVRLAA